MTTKENYIFQIFDVLDNKLYLSLHFYIIITYGKVLNLCKILNPHFLTNVYI